MGEFAIGERGIKDGRGETVVLARARHAAPPLARHGRILLELVSDDGELIGQGEATAEIVALAAARPSAS